MTENLITAKTWKYAAMSPAGASTLAKTMVTKFGCEIVSPPKKTKDDMWEFEFTNPFRKEKNGK